MTACAFCQQTGKMVMRGPDEQSWWCLPCLRTWFKDFLS
jgi:hypothetical protein